MSGRTPASFLDAVVCPGCCKVGTPADFVREWEGGTYAACPTKGCGYEWPDDEQAPTLGEVLTRDDGGRWQDVDMRAYLGTLVKLLGFDVPTAKEPS